MKRIHVLVILCGMLNPPPLFAQTGLSGDPSAIKFGTLTGRFLYDGIPPKSVSASRFDTIDLNTPLSRDPTGRVSGVELAYREYLQRGMRPRTLDDSLLVGNDRGVANVLLFVTSVDIPIPAMKPSGEKPTVLHIRDGQFMPRVMAVTVNHMLEIKNADAVSFGFHLQMVRNASVNVQVAANSTKQFVFSNPEKLPLPFRSDQQIWATGFLFVHDNPYFAVSSPQGTFTISNLPPGEWEFRAWHEKAGYLKAWPMGRFNFEITAGTNDLGDVQLSADLFHE